MKTNYPDSLTIQQYLEGKLDPDVMHQLEKQALDDPFLWDALEGYATHTDPAADLSILQRQLHERIVHLQENKKVFDFTWQRLSVAAAAAVMFVSAGILFWMNSPKPDDRLASESHRPVEVSVIDKDSVETVIKAKDQPVVASLGNGQSAPEQPQVSAYEPANPVQRKAVISPRAESEISKQQSAPDAEPGARTMSAVSAPAAARKMGEASAAGVLNEVAIGYRAQPKQGWEAYQEYVSLNTRKFKSEPLLKGAVLLSFEIDALGKPSNIKVIKGLSEPYDREAIRILNDGPDWVPSPDGQKSQNRIELSF